MSLVRFIPLIIILLIGFRGNAALIPHQSCLITGSGTYGSTYITPPGWASSSYTDLTRKGVITLGVDHHYIYYVDQSVTEVTLSITKYSSVTGLPTVDSPISKVIMVSYYPIDSVTYVDENTITIDNVEKMDISITQVKVNGVVQTSMPANIYIQGDVFVDRICDFVSQVNFNTYNLNVASTDWNSDCDVNGVADEAIISWDAVPRAEEYQLEWTYINTVDLTSTEIDNLSIDFQNNSTRISTTDLSYRVSLRFDKGILVFRVRAVGRSSTSPYNFLYSAWSTTDGPKTLGILSSSIKKATVPFDIKKNWQYTAIYGEEGKKKEVISFYDGSLRNRQMVAKVSSDHNAIVGETIYDYQGRPVVKVLPVPVPDPTSNCSSEIEENSLRYYESFNKNSSNVPYSKADFDITSEDGCSPLEVGTMGTGSGASNYYSGSNVNVANSQGYVPNAEGYPFSQVEYMPDNTGRIRRQGGVGKEFQLSTDESHPTQYFYAHPFQEQIDRLFGSEVGDASHYQKNMIIDPNGQVTVSYLDQEGRVIATSLAGEAPDNVVQLPSAASVAPLVVDLFAKDANGNSTSNKLSFDGMSKEFSQTIALSAASDVTISYDIHVPAYTNSCLGSLCLNCVYDLSIEVRDLCGDLKSPIALSPRLTGRFTTTEGVISFNTDCATYDYNNTFTIPNLPVGTYQITKTLTINQEALETYLQMYTDPVSGMNTCFSTYDEILEHVGESSNIDDCSEEFSCAQCVANLGSLLQYTQAGGTEAAYNEELAACNAPCKGASYYENMRDVLMLDVRPDGQYGQYLNNQNVVDVSLYPLSVLNVSNKLPKSTNALPSLLNAHWRNPKYDVEATIQPYYFDEDGVTRSRIPLTDVVFTGTPGSTPALSATPVLGTNVFQDNATGNYYTYPQFLNSVNDFISYYNVNQQWANSLVYFHPEYPYLKKYKEYYVKVNPSDTYSSESFEQYMISINTWTGAQTAGFINSMTGSVNARINHFWDTPGSSPGAFLRDPYGQITAALNTKIMNYATINGVNYSMMQVAAMMNRGNNNMMGTVPTSTDLDLFADVIGNTTTQNTQLRDAEWMTFRGLYLTAKQELQFNAAQTVALSSDPGYNDCIGNESFNPFDNGFVTINSSLTPFFSGGFFNLVQPCSIYTLGYYTHKQPRFGNQLANVNQDPSQVAYQVYLQTGQCPIAMSLQRLLNEGASDHILLSTGVSATNTMNSLSGLVLAMQNFETPVSIPTLTWTLVTGTTTSSILEISLQGTSGAWANFKLVKASGSATYSWSDIVSFNNLQFTQINSGLYEFTVSTKVNIGGTLVDQYLTGFTTLKIGNCSFSEVCELNDFGRTLQDITRSLALMGTLSSTTYVDLTALPYSNFLNNAIKYTINPAYSGGTLKWKYDAAIPGFELTDVTKTIKIKITGTDPTSFSLSSLSSIAVIDELRAGSNNKMELVCKNASNNYLVTLSCELLGTGNVLKPVGKCGLDDAILCTGLEYDTYDDLMAVLEFSLENQNEPFNLYNTPLWTSALSSQLPSVPISIIGTDDITRRILTYDMPGGCDLVLTYNGVNPGFSYDAIVSVNSVKLLNQNIYGSYNEFRLYITYSAGGIFYQDSLEGTSCFKLKECTSCTQTPNDEAVGSATSTQTDGIIDLSSLNDEEFTEVDNNSEMYCIDLYEDYVSAYQLFQAHQTASPSCTNYATLYPMMTYAQFVSGRYCCGNSMTIAFNKILNLSTTTTCPSTYAAADQCLAFNLTGTACTDLHTIYTNVITYFNSSAWATTNGAHLTAVGSGVVSCKCEASYLNYLLEYLTANPNQSLSHPMTITAYCALMDAEPVSTCSSKYDEYVSCTKYFNAHSGLSARAIVDYDVFMDNELCNCVDEYCSNLSLTLSGLTSETKDLLLFCLSSKEVPCVTDTPSVHFETFEIAFNDPCTEFYQSNNEVNAQIDYNQQVQDFYTQLGAAYIAHCMKATEGMSMTYNEIEHHFTLYYYDQAGNLIKTIPPEGVEYVDMSNSTIRNAILNDRLNNTHQVITNHRMATTYSYNSLNQLVAQNMPDQDAVDVFEPTLPNGLPIGLTTTAIQMLDANQGYLSGFMDATGTAPLTNRGYLFKTTNGGLNWVRITNTLGTDLKEVYMVSSTVGYALASYGLSLITKDGGLTWDLTDMLNTANYSEYVAMEVVGTDAYLLNRTGRIFKINSSGVSSVYLNTVGSLSGYTITEFKDFTLQNNVADFKGIIYLVTTNDGTESYDATFVTTNTTGTLLKMDKTVVGNLGAVSFYSSTDGFIAGADGNISGLVGAAAASYRQRLKKSGAKGLIDQIHMLDANNGIARITEDGIKVIRKTTDAGTTWTPLSNEYTNATLSFNRRSASGLEVLVQGYDIAPLNAAYEKNIIINSSGVCVELNQSPSLAQNINMTLVSTYNDGTNLTYFGVAFDGTNYRLYKSNSFTGAGTDVSFTSMAILGNSTVIPKEMVIAKSGSELAVEVLTTGGAIYRSQSTGSGTAFPAFAAVSGMTSIVSIDKITISALDYILAYRSSDGKVYQKAATSSGSYSAYATTITLGGSVITKIGVHGSYLTLVGTNGGIFTAAGVTATAGSTLTFTDRTRHQLYGLTELKYTPSMNLIVGENGQAYTRPILNLESIATLRPLGITSDLCAMSQTTYNSATHYLFGGKNGALAMITSTGIIAPILYTTSGASVTDHIGGKTINDISSITYTSGTAMTKVVIVGDNGILYFTPNISTDLFVSALSQTQQNFLGVFQLASSEKSIVVGTSSEVFRYNQNIGTRINRVFGPKYKDVHFENGQAGTLIGDYYFVRATLDGGLSWKFNRVSTSPGVTGLTKVWTKSKPNGEHFAVIGAVNYVIKMDNGTATQTAIGGTVNDLQFSKTNPLFGYVAYNSSVAKITLTLSSGTYNLPGTYTSVYTAANPIRGLHVFENNSVIMVGDGGGINYYRYGPTASSYTLATVSGVTFRDVYFVDNTIGLAVGDAGKIYSLKSTNNDNTTHDIISSSGFSANPETFTDPESTVTPGLYNITALAFSSNNTTIYGGGFISSTDINSQKAMVRYLKYEKGLFSSRFYYDRLGRIVVSQNSRQAGNTGIADNKYSYTLYDGLGRATEAGEKSENGVGGTKFASVFGTNVGGTTVPNVVDDANLAVWLNFTPTTTRKEVTKSYYDVTNAAIASDAGFISTTFDLNTQRKRMVHVTYSETYSTFAYEYDHATHYNYDIHGNVKTLYQDNRLIKNMSGIGDHRLKKIDYIYDLVSGNVHRVDYQTGQSDQWHHAYSYDADNRVTDVYSTVESPLTSIASSIASIQNETELSTLWDREATYEYYEHGPLARTIIGDQEVQGIDYVYTLQGWMKSVNSNTLDVNRDPGMDGSGLGNQFVARDVFGYSLHYFDGDYPSAIGGNNTFVANQSGSDLLTFSNDMYNGNIGRMVTTITHPDTREILPLGFAYKHDQLNRLISAVGTKDIDIPGNQWHDDLQEFHYTNYLTYDANGNILTQNRTGQAEVQMDQLYYYYKRNAGGKIISNRLYHVGDDADDTAFPDDIDDQGAFYPAQATINSLNNYEYDKEGRLIKDKKIGRIYNWRSDGKVSSVYWDPSSTAPMQRDVYFEYDAMGHRIAKHIQDENTEYREKSIYYVLDAKGEVMSVYERMINSSEQSVGFTQTEKHIYGSSRLGVHNERIELLGTLNDTYSMDYVQHHIGDKTYELTNHLGNVLSVVSDKIIPEEVLGGGTVTAIDDQFAASGNLLGWAYPPGPGYGTIGSPSAPDFSLTATGGKLVIYAGSTADPGDFVVGGIEKYYTFLDGMSYTFSFDVITSDVMTYNIGNASTGLTGGYISSSGSYSYTFTGDGLPGTILFMNQEGTTMQLDNIKLTYTAPATTNFLADIRQATDYSPFGVKLDKRDFKLTPAYGSITPYRYGFQNQEEDDELKGDGNSMNYTFRMHDPRLGRFFAIDPLSAKYPHYSPYQFSGNRLVDCVELEGLEPASAADKKSALDKITKFSENSKSNSAWSKIKKADFVSSLTAMINDPSTIDQAQTNLCGVAIALKAAVEYEPEKVVEMAISLYEKGEWKGVKRNSDLRDDPASNGLDAASFVIMTSLRQTCNVFFDYDPKDDAGASGFTWPGDVDLIAKKMGMSITTSDDFVKGKGTADKMIAGMQTALKNKHFIVLCINASEFQKTSSWSVTPNHYIQITGVSVKGDNVTFDWWSWGQPQQKITMSKENFYESSYFVGTFN
jgi:photosystem II stability/assembly factor-like uncharacterized protein